MISGMTRHMHIVMALFMSMWLVVNYHIKRDDWGEQKRAPHKSIFSLYLCMFVRVYVSVYVAIRRPRGHSACAQSMR